MNELIPTLSTCSSSFTYHYEWEYDVFLNFRGEDTRSNFTGHLYHALCEKDIRVFIDDRLKRGEEITPALLQAIDKSRIAIVILSVNYALSTFCLEELVKILECSKQKGQLVFPVFYKVDPSDVRHLRESYREALARHEKKFKNNEEKIQNWKSALQEVANLSGWHWTERNEYEYEFVKKIVEEVSKRINHTLLYVAKYPVGLESRAKEIISLLDFGCNKEFVMVGIHGTGGIGKTTIAYAVHNVIIDQFEGVCFLSDVRKKSNEHDLVKLQQTLLSKLTGEKEIIDNVNEGISIISRRLRQKKVLLILDDVDNQKQLQALAGRDNWFGFGSRIIITTRDKHLLDVHGVDRYYNVKELCSREALELFSWNAFRKKEVDSRYASISDCVINYCKGLPLALEIIGSNLSNKTQDEWKSAIDTYEKILDNDIQNILRISYDGLEERQREIFLDIACLFKGWQLDDVKNRLLHGRGYDPEYHIGVLVEKSLIRIDQWKHVEIHDLMAQMGKEIVRSESPSNPENWSRLWNYIDIICVLEENKGTDKIEALMLDMPQDEEVRWNGKAFRKMKNLKILIIRSAHFPWEPKYLPNSLRVIEWENYSSSTLPPDFHPRNLAVLNLCRSSLELIKPFKSLTEMILKDCHFLKQVADVSGAPSLKIINIRNCRNLVEVDDSVGFLDKLELLHVVGCNNLRIFPRFIRSASLELLDLSKCLSLQNVPEIFGLIENNLATQYLRRFPVPADPGCLVLYKSPHTLLFRCGVLMLPKLENILNDEFRHFKGFEVELHFFPTRDLDCNNLTNKHFAAWRPYYRSLKRLYLPSNNLTDEFFYQRLPWFPNLNYLYLSSNKFTILPECMNECRYLEILILDRCKDLREIKGIPPKLKFLSTTDCLSLTSQSSKKLLSQAFHEDGGRQVIVPGFRIPKWLDHRCMGSSISFWFRDEFPRLALCFVSISGNVKSHIFINGIEVLDSKVLMQYLSENKTPHISLLDFHEWSRKIKIVLKQDEWNHVLISHEDIYGMGVHVYKKKKGLDNVRFINPNPLNRTFTIKHKLDLITCFSLSKKFCPFLGMQGCDIIPSDVTKIKGRYSARFHFVSKLTSIMEAPTKIKFLKTKIFGDWLPTCCNLFKRKLVNSPMCPICETEYETIEHVFLECPWTQPLWFGCDLGWTMEHRRSYYENGIASWFDEKISCIEKVLPNAKSAIGLMGNICWTIWKARNEFVLRDKPVNPLEALLTAKALHMADSFNLEASTSTTHLENVVSAQVVSNINTEMEPTCNKVPIKIPSIVREDDVSKAMAEEVQRKHVKANAIFPDVEEEPLVPSKRKYQRKTQSSLASTQTAKKEKEKIKKCLKKSKKIFRLKKKSYVILRSTTASDTHVTQSTEDPVPTSTSPPPLDTAQSQDVQVQVETATQLEPIAETTNHTLSTQPEISNSPSLQNLVKHASSPNPPLPIHPMEPDVQINQGSKASKPSSQTCPKQPTKIENSLQSALHPSSSTDHPPQDTKMQMLHQDQCQFNEDEEAIAALESLLLVEEETFSTSISTEAKSNELAPDLSDERKSEIKNAIHTLESMLDAGLDTAYLDKQRKSALERSLAILQGTNEAEITIGLKSFVLDFQEQLSSFFDKVKACALAKLAFQELSQKKNELVKFSKGATLTYQQLASQYNAATKSVEDNTKNIASVESKIATLEEELRQLKAQQPNLEAAVQSANQERLQFAQRTKEVLGELKATSTKVPEAEVAYKVAKTNKMMATHQWKKFKSTFALNFKRFSDSM